jgi:hypothetical protein
MKFYRVKNKAGEVHVIADRDLGPQYQVLAEVDHPSNPKPKPVAKIERPALPAGMVRIKNPDKPGQFYVIAESEFDPSSHERFVAEPVKPVAKAHAQEASVPQADAPVKAEPSEPVGKGVKGRDTK